ncbi:hypothetical protein Y900_009590 [Mycolicibacterium aromaticivorans JS19b1 = JCM 16368]|uniref:PASTA domain-containing protein n=1 Tax=Mycolicibacterium aromaticivorans JS19b1 = JCM 16368 TaxID=1440774 RepID=A0A064CKD9_9MYCO|nr:hypothetical protein [Mycolicibacterium aromaticivorans]KDE99193.1 hypothetical protein Y900_009590 [Mycolicibacterium aromaticivorans JS19b1 = JCM 16368]
MGAKARHSIARLAVAPVAVVGAVVVAAPAAADPPWPAAGTESAADTIRDLQSQGYRVGINWVFGYTSQSLDRCSVTGIHNPGGPPDESAEPTTVFIDVSCPDHDNW